MRVLLCIESSHVRSHCLPNSLGSPCLLHRGHGVWHSLKSFFISGPDYDSTFLRNEIERITGDHTLANTLTNVLMPAFDIRRLEPILFSSYEDPEEIKPHLRDVCIATSAAPTYFSAHHFDVQFTDGWRELFHLIDGGVGANNPTMVAISRVAREVLRDNKNKNFKPDLNFKDLVVISLGTGSTKEPDKGAYKAEDCAKWAHIGWIHSKVEDCQQSGCTGIGWIPGKAEDPPKWCLIGRIAKFVHMYRKHRTRKPIIDMLMHANDFWVDFYVAMLLRAQGCEDYLRIQTKVHTYHVVIDHPKQ